MRPRPFFRKLMQMYRAKDSTTGEWVYGFLIISRDRPGRTAHFIMVDDGKCNEPHDWRLIVPTTLQRSLFFQDKNGMDVYLGMKVRTFYDDGTPGMEGVIVDQGVGGPGLKSESHPDGAFPLYIFPSFEVIE